MDLDLKDNVGAVTGGSVGIGLAIARGLAAEGVHLALCARDEQRVREVAHELSEEFGVQAIGVAADVSDTRGISTFTDAIETTFGGADILSNKHCVNRSPLEAWAWKALCVSHCPDR